MNLERTSTTAMPRWRRECAFVDPQPGRWAWLGDRHSVVAMLVAWPAWVGLAAMAGPHMAAPPSPAAWLLLLCVQPIVEEFVFRGVLQGQLLRLTRAARLGGPTIANTATTLAFVVVHLPVQPAAWAVAVAVPSLVFGHLRERFGSVLPAVAVHAYYNAGFGLVAWWLHDAAA